MRIVRPQVDMRIIINRIENDIAVCELENGKTINVPKCIFENAQEGKVYDITADDKQEEILRQKNASKLKNLFNK